MIFVGPIAQGSEQSAHNRKVPGSNPGGPTNKAMHLTRRYLLTRRDLDAR